MQADVYTSAGATRQQDYLNGKTVNGNHRFIQLARDRLVCHYLIKKRV